MSQQPSDSDQTSRRRFLRRGAAITAGATALSASRVPAVHAAEDHTLKIALVGCGGRGTGAAIQALSTAGPTKLWAMADAFEDRLQSSLQSLQRGAEARYDRQASQGLADQVDVPKERQFVGLDAYRKAIDSGVDVVLLTGPPGFRPQHFEYAVSAGKHVFMEKPVASDAHGVRRVMATAQQAKQSGLKVGVGLQRHHQSSYQEAIRRIHDGQLGDLVALRCYWNSGPPAKSPMSRSGDTQLQHQVRNWYFFAWLSGDHICEQHIHNLDVCNWVMQGHPVEAHGMGGRQVRIGKQYGDIFDHHAVEFTYADGTKMFSQCRQMRGCANQVAEFAHGTQARANLGTTVCEIQAGQNQLWTSKQPRGKRETSPYQVEHDVLFDAIRRDLPHNEAEHGAISTMTAILGRLATYSGKIIRWDDAIASDLRLSIDGEDWNSTAPVQPNDQGEYPIAVPGVTRVL